MSEKVRYVRCDEEGAVDYPFAFSADVTLEDMEADPNNVQNYPIICKLVPVSFISVKRQAARERKERKGKK